MAPHAVYRDRNVFIYVVSAQRWPLSLVSPFLCRGFCGADPHGRGHLLVEKSGPSSPLMDLYRTRRRDVP